MKNPMRVDDIIEVEIHDLAATGKAVGLYKGMVVMLDAGLPDETVECRVTAVKRRYAIAKQLRVLKHSDKRIEPRCRHFEICGGCKWQNLDYQVQLGYKSNFVSEGLKRIGKFEGFEIDPVIAAEEQFCYRNKMEYSFSAEDDDLNLGLHRRGRYDSVFNIQECHLQSEQSVTVLTAMREKAIELQIPFYNYQTRSGQLRFLVIREGKNTDNLMINLVTFDKEFSGKDELFKHILSEFPNVTSLFHTVNGEKSNVAVSDELFKITGEDHIKESIGDSIFQITPFSFFQTNSKQVKVLYDVIAEHASLTSEQTMLDLFCGCGSIGIYLADRVKSLVGVELNEDAIKMAGVNAELNNVNNAEFIAGDSRRILYEFSKTERKFDLVITDPPRAGMGRRIVKRIIEMSPERIVSVSCNPATMARDLEQFADGGYELTRVTPVDMFPQTAHIEAVATLIKK